MGVECLMEHCCNHAHLVGYNSHGSEIELVSAIMSSPLIIASTGLFTKALAAVLTSTHLHSPHHLRDALFSSIHKNRPLLTVSNHTSTIDDPFIWSVLFGSRELLQLAWNGRMRWVMGAGELMFTNPMNRWYFGKGRVLACIRGEGVYQVGMQECIQVLNNGGWVHVFPEGKTYPDSYRKYGKLKWGVGRMIEETRPLVVPIRHWGLEHVKPLYSKRIGLFKRVDVTCGEIVDTSKIDISKGMKSEDGIPDHRRRWIKWTEMVADLLNNLGNDNKPFPS